MPELSEEVSRGITVSYVQDFYYGLKMGIWKFNKPKYKSVTLLHNGCMEIEPNS